MTQDELKDKLKKQHDYWSTLVHYTKPEFYENTVDQRNGWSALLAVVELHKPEYWENIHDPNWNGNECSVCFTDGNLETPSARIDYPCPTIQAIEKELK